MQIQYETCFEHWLAAQIFHSEQSKSLAKHRVRKNIQAVVWLTLVDAFIFFLNGTSTFFWVYTWFISIWIIVLIFQRSQMRRLIARQLQLAYQREFEKLTDRTAVWNVTTEHVSIKDASTETIFKWDSVRCMTFCPDYVFIAFGISGRAWLAKQAIGEPKYQAFCDFLVKTYQDCASQQGITAQIEHRDWTLDAKALMRQASRPCSAKKIIFTVLWGFAFLIVAMVFLGIIVFALSLFTTLCSDSAEYVDRTATLLLMGWLIGSSLLMVLGIVLGLFEKLPGTKSGE